MRESVPFLVTVVALAALMGAFTRLAARVRRRGLAGAAVRGAPAAHDEAFHATAHASHYEVQAQAERRAPELSPDGKWTPRGGAAGRPGLPGGTAAAARVRRPRRLLPAAVRRVRTAVRRRAVDRKRP